MRNDGKKLFYLLIKLWLKACHNLKSRIAKLDKLIEKNAHLINAGNKFLEG